MKNLPDRLPVFVLDDGVLLPGAVARLQTEEDSSALARKLLKSGERRVVVALSKAESELGVHAIASLARVEAVSPDGGVLLTVQGRVRVLELGEEEPVPTGRVEEIELPAGATSTEVEALALEARKLARDILAMLPGVPEDLPRNIARLRDPGALADLLTHYVPAAAVEKQKILEAFDPPSGSGSS